MSRTAKSIIYIVDDDPSIRKALARLLRSANLEARSFSSPAEFLNFPFQRDRACLILDIRMNGFNGLDLQRKLVAAGIELPVIFITAFHNPRAMQEAKKLGALGYFRKPIDDQALLDLIDWALSRSGT